MDFLSDGELARIPPAYGYWMVVAAVGLQSMGLMVPGQTTLIAAAIIAGASRALDIGFVIAAAAAGAIVGYTIAFFLGREFGYRLIRRYGRYLRATESGIKLGQYLFLRYGGKVVFFGRFLAALRVLAALLAGANCMPWPRFLLANARAASCGPPSMERARTPWARESIALPNPSGSP